MGVKNVMPVMDPDEAEKKFEKVATSTKATPEDDDKEGACESVNQALDALKEAMTSQDKYKAMYTKKQEEDKKKKKTGNPAFDDESHHSNAKNRNESVEQALDALKYSIKKNPPQLTELNRYEKEKGEDTKTGKKIVKGGTAKNDKAFQAVMSTYKDERMGANEKKKKKGEKKEEGGRILRMQNKKKEEKKKGEEFAARGKKKGFKSTQDYANTVARYGGEDNMEKGRGLGS